MFEYDVLFLQADIFLETVDALFGDVNDERQLHLFNSLQTRMIAKEAENAGETSRARRANRGTSRGTNSRTPAWVGTI